MLLPFHLHFFILSTCPLPLCTMTSEPSTQEDSEFRRDSSSSGFQQGLDCSYHSGSLRPVIFFANKSSNYHYYGAYSDKHSPLHRETVTHPSTATFCPHNFNSIRVRKGSREIIQGLRSGSSVFYIFMALKLTTWL